MGYKENFEAVTLDKTVRGRIRLALVKQAMSRSTATTPVPPTPVELVLIHRILDGMDENFLTELALAVAQDAAVVESATDAQLDTRILAVWDKLVAGFAEPVTAV